MLGSVFMRKIMLVIYFPEGSNLNPDTVFLDNEHAVLIPQVGDKIIVPNQGGHRQIRTRAFGFDPELTTVVLQCE